MRYEPVIGLEIHVELNTRTKMFCASLNDPDEAAPNTNICPVCMGHPGTLPTINRDAVKKVMQVALALGSTIQESTQFDRKNYFYPDLPKGYQISQYASPIALGGSLTLSSASQEKRQIRIRRIHLEEDTGRLLHPVTTRTPLPSEWGERRSPRSLLEAPAFRPSGNGVHDTSSKTSFIDFNRAGIPLMELVTEPDMHSAEEVCVFAESLQRIFRYLRVSKANMEKGEMRLEANISLRPIGSTSLGTRVEIKNLNSFKFAEKAIAYEISRQEEILRNGGAITQETRGWDEVNEITVSQRLKEESQDYRYFPEPDLPPLHLSPTLIEEVQISVPELPDAKRERFVKEFKIDSKLADILTRDRNTAEFYEATVSELREWLSSRGDKETQTPFRLAANYLTTDIAKFANDEGMPLRSSALTPENLAELITYLSEGKISSKSAKVVLKEMFKEGVDPSGYIEEHSLWQISASGDLVSVVEEILAAHPDAVVDYRSGKTTAIQYLVGQVMKKSKGANPETVRQLLLERLA